MSTLYAPLLRRLGKSDLMVTPVGLGCWQFSKKKGFAGRYWPLMDDREITGIVSASLEGGVNWFDTAEVYGWGESEKALSRSLAALGKSPAKVIIATKWFPILRTARSLTRTIEARLTALGVSRIDLHQIHNPYSFSSIPEQMRAMAQLVAGGKVRWVGVSNFSAEKMRIAHEALARRGIPLVANQVSYNLLNRRIETDGVLETARELGISIIAYSPLAQGILSGRFHDELSAARAVSGPRKHQEAFKPRSLARSLPLVTALKEIAKRCEATPSQVALCWLIAFHGDMVVAIPGATRIAQAVENAGAMGVTLTKEELARLDEVSRAIWTTNP